MASNQKLVCFSDILLTEPQLSNKMARAEIHLTRHNGAVSAFPLMLRYEQPLNECHLPLLRLAFMMPLLNYGLFSQQFTLQFPLSEADVSLLNDLNVVFSRDIFVNKILRRRAHYILPEFLPDENNVQPGDAEPKAVIKPSDIVPDTILSDTAEDMKCGILSSGGKESLATYGLLKELGCEVHPLYINESGGHWHTALPAYRYHDAVDPHTSRVWTNIDRFYTFMLDHLAFIRPDHKKIRADTYPIRLCIFPYYVFALLPIFVERRIGNLFIGSEFDDLREPPLYHGIPHYFGIYDQHQDFDNRMQRWYALRMPSIRQWSAMRNVSGLIVERILLSRYPHLAKHQRSCHSCHFEQKEIVPCGSCSKCLGILLFLLANDADPTLMNYKKEHIDSFANNITPSSLRLDQDEKDQSFFLLKNKSPIPNVRCVDHVEKIHLDPRTCDITMIPPHLRERLLGILEQYTTGYTKLEGEQWASVKHASAEY